MPTPDSKSSPLAFSICIPVYNGRQFLPETLESVRSQTHPNWELIIVEDASPEPSRDIVEEFAASVSQNVRYYANDRNLGCGETREKGFGYAEHDYLAPLDADDIWKPHHLAEMARTLAESGSDFVFTGYLAFSKSTNDIDVEFSPAPEIRDQLRIAYFYSRFWLQPSSVAFHRRIFEKVGSWTKGLEQKPNDLPGNRDTGEDRNFFMRAIFFGIEPVWTGLATVYYRQHNESMRGQEHHVLGHRAWLHNQLGLLADHPIKPQRIYLAHINANAARDYAHVSGHRRWSAYFYFRSWRWYPLRIDRLFHAVKSRLGF